MLIASLTIERCKIGDWPDIYLVLTVIVYLVVKPCFMRKEKRPYLLNDHVAAQHLEKACCKGVTIQAQIRAKKSTSGVSPLSFV